MRAVTREFVRSGFLICLISAMVLMAGCGKKEVARPKQTRCPVTGERCNREYSIVTQGYRIYGCSPACLPSIKARPKKFIDKIRANGEEPELVVNDASATR